MSKTIEFRQIYLNIIINARGEDNPGIVEEMTKAVKEIMEFENLYWQGEEENG